MNRLGEYIRTVLGAEHVSQKELADGIHLSPAQVSRIIKGTRGADVFTVGRMAVFLRRSPTELFRVAGFLPPVNKDSTLIELITHIVNQLPTEEEKQDVAEYARMRLRIAEERGKYETRKPLRRPASPEKA